MNTRFLSVLLLLFLGLGLASCSKDESNSDKTAGQAEGEKFRNALETYRNSSDPFSKAAAGLDLWTSYSAYKENKDDAEWSLLRKHKEREL